MKFKQKADKSQNEKIISFFIEDQRAWIDLIISKASLIFATVIILAAVYHLAGDFQELSRKEELDIATQELAYIMNSVGSGQYGTLGSKKEYIFSSYGIDKNVFDRMNVSVSGEYVAISYRENNKEMISAAPLVYKTLSYSPDELSIKMIDQFSASGNASDPVTYPHRPTDVSKFLAELGTKEANLNTSTKVHIVKTLICCINNTEVKELEYTLVYQ